MNIYIYEIRFLLAKYINLASLQIILLEVEERSLSNLRRVDQRQKYGFMYLLLNSR